MEQDYKEREVLSEVEIDKFKISILSVNPNLFEALWGRDGQGNPTVERQIEQEVDWEVPESEDDVKTLMNEWQKS